MKKFKIFLMLLLVSAVSVCVATSCKDDDPDDSSNHDPALIGTWVRSDNVFTIIFNADGTYEERSRSNSWTKGTWSTKNNKLTWETTDGSSQSFVGEGDTDPYSISGNTLYLWDREYIRQE